MIKERVVKFLKTCKFIYQNGSVKFEVSAINAEAFRNEEGLEFFDLWFIFSERERELMINEVFIVR